MLNDFFMLHITRKFTIFCTIVQIVNFHKYTKKPILTFIQTRSQSLIFQKIICQQPEEINLQFAPLYRPSIVKK